MRQPAKYAVTSSANSQALRDDHYRHDDAAKRGLKDALADAQEVALPPHDLRPDVVDDWINGYRQGWTQRRAKSTAGQERLPGTES